LIAIPSVVGRAKGRDVVEQAAELDVGLAEDHEQVPRAALLQQVVAHRKIGVHPGEQHPQPPHLPLLGWLREPVARRRELLGPLARTHVEREASACARSIRAIAPSSDISA
jgi:hypothetical protein